MYQVLSNTFREIFATREKPMKVLFFDTETNEYAPKNMDSVSLSNVNNLPYIVQFSYIIYEFTKKGGRTCKVVDHIIKLPEEIGITQDCTNCHGITKQMSTEKGIPVEHVIMNFLYDIESVDFILGHNLEFDLKMAFVEIQRLVNSSKTASQSNYYLEKMNQLQNYENYYCSMKESVEICKIERENSRGKYFKFPSLTELHEYCFQSKPENLHNSLNDVAVGLRCFGFLEYSRDICEEDAVIRELIQKLL